MTEEKDINPEQSLAIIQQMMDSARAKFEENGLTYLVWGTLSALAGVAHFLLLRSQQYHLIFLPYLCLMLAGNAFTVWYYRSKPIKRTKYNPISILIRRLWLIIALNANILGFFLFPVLHNNVTPVILVLLSIGVGVSGLAVRSLLLVWAGASINVIGIVSFFVPPDYQPLMLSLAATTAMLIPGMILYWRSVRTPNLTIHDRTGANSI
jgi:hypothetical protein